MTLVDYWKKVGQWVVLLYQKWEMLLLGPFGGLHLQVLLGFSLPAQVQLEVLSDRPSFGLADFSLLPL